MVAIPGPVEFVMGSPPTEVGREGGQMGATEAQHQIRIGRCFAVAANEVTVEQFLRFRKDHPYSRQFAATADCPVTPVRWYEAAAYCNWLSRQEGMPEDQWCYVPNVAGEYAEGMKMAPDYLAAPAIACRPRRNGSMPAGPAPRQVDTTARTTNSWGITPGIPGTRRTAACCRSAV